MLMRATKAVIVAAVWLGGCADARVHPLDPTLAVALQTKANPGQLDAEEIAAAKLVARGLAMSLGASEVRDEVRAALASSANIEGKLHLSSYLEGRGGRLLREAIRLSRDSAFSGRLARLRPLEFYMPVASHRESWRGQEAPLVAFALREGDNPIAFDSTGALVVLNRRSPPAHPVLALTSLETDLRAQEILNKRGEVERTCQPLPQESLATAMRRCRASDLPAVSSRLLGTGESATSLKCGPQVLFKSDACASGLFLREIHFQGVDVESWLAGSPEYQIHVYARKAGDPPGSTSDWQCSGENIEYNNPGVPKGSYWWSTSNAEHFAGIAQILTDSQMTAMRAVSDTFNLQVWEDDGYYCKNTFGAFSPTLWDLAYGSGLGWGATKLEWNLGLILTEPFGINGPVILWAGMAVYRAVSLLRDLLEGGDDPIGVLVRKEETPFSYPNNQRGNVVILGNGRYKGWATITYQQPSTNNMQTVASVVVQDSAPKIQRGYLRSLAAVAYDQAGFATSDTSFTWSSSNTAVASVSGSGVVSGNAVGTATITASLGAFSSSVVVSVLDIGLPVLLAIAPSYLALPEGAGAQLYDRFYDSNGFEVPVTVGTVWHSANNGVCSIDANGFVTGLAGGSTTISATNDTFQASIPCSVSYGGSFRQPVGLKVPRRDSTKKKR